VLSVLDLESAPAIRSVIAITDLLIFLSHLRRRVCRSPNELMQRKPQKRDDHHCYWQRADLASNRDPASFITFRGWGFEPDEWRASNSSGSFFFTAAIVVNRQPPQSPRSLNRERPLH